MLIWNIWIIQLGKKLKRSPTSSKNKPTIHEILLEAHQKGVQQAIDLSIRTGVPLVVEENGKIRDIKPKFKYVCVPIHPEDSKGPRTHKTIKRIKT